MRKSQYPKIANTLGKRIRKRRMDLGLTLLEVANKVGITESYLSRIEADKKIPDAPVVIKIAYYLKDNVEVYLKFSLQKILPISSIEQVLDELKDSPPSPLKKTIKSLLKNIQLEMKPYKPPSQKELDDLAKRYPELLNRTPADIKKELKEDPPPE